MTILNRQALIVTKKQTSVVTLQELKSLATHLSLNLQIDEAQNGRVWAFKQKGEIILSNKNFNDLPTESNYTKTTCQVSPDILSFHTHLDRLVAQAKRVHQNFLDIHIAFPALHLLTDTCFLGKPFTDLLQLSLATHKTCLNKKMSQNKNKRSILGALLGDSDLINQLSMNMQKALHVQDTNFEKIYNLDKSLVNNLNTLLENEQTHDKYIRVVFQLLKSIGYYLDMTNNRAVYKD